jgi:hypothetical protein
MASIVRSLIAAAVLIATIVTPAAAQAPIDVYELADYRLTTEVFERFVQASRRVGDITREDSAFAFAPLFTKDLLLSGDAVAGVNGLVARLQNHAGLSTALEAAKITPREYAKFSLTMVVAHLAHGFLKSGVLTQVAPGAATANVAFVKAHETDVNAVLEHLGIHD